ncbi:MULTISPECIES: alpha/beta fold hydrolase [unclassified Nocardioides]|uniref:alpha/beta fold hydrolase n=1 Tax=unclassified Nocardioides TaxID=2615069 RepID=UPI0009F0EBC5|nr:MULTISPECIES: alpha/beta fold hydrolase [unclassified Nocardioides]GAW49017.1 alpha/beta hydrolase fold protein [Nocardioides sp. PD653-B2]GAW53173.1 alpha/beta hydrolase fold protein [Nocardioides sp. PD653]
MSSDRITQFENDGLTFDVRDEGPLDGTPVVLLHGFPERSTSWRHVAPLLHAQGLRTFAPDQRGYSPGARPPRRRDYTAGRLVGDALALIDTIGGPVHLVGHDWGAAVGWGVVMTRPAQVRSWTAVSVPHTGAFATSWVTSTQGLKSWYMGAFQLPRLAELSARRPGGPFDRSMRRSGMTTEDLARFRSEIVEYGALPGGLAWYRAIPFTSPGAARRRVSVPTTLVWSDGDVAVGRAAVDATARWVDAPYELVVLGGVSHWIPTQAPEALAEAILARVAG